MFLGSSVFFRATGTVPYRIRSNIASGHIGRRRRSKAGAAERASLGEGEGRGRGGIQCYGKGSIGERVWELLGFWGEERGLEKRERHVEPVHSKTVLEQTLPLASSE